MDFLSFFDSLFLPSLGGGVGFRVKVGKSMGTSFTSFVSRGSLGKFFYFFRASSPLEVLLWNKRTILTFPKTRTGAGLPEVQGCPRI